MFEHNEPTCTQVIVIPFNAHDGAVRIRCTDSNSTT